MKKKSVDLSSLMVTAEPKIQAEPKPAKKEAAPPAAESNIPAVEKTLEPPPPSEQPSVSDQLALMTQIRLCIDTFPKKLASLKNAKLDKMTPEELEKTWSDIEYVMGSKQNLNTTVNGAIMMLKTLEDLAADYTPLQIQGTHRVFNDEDVLDDLKFVCIRSTSKLKASPEQRLGFKVLTTAYQMHVINSAKAAKAVEVVPPTDEKFADL